MIIVSIFINKPPRSGRVRRPALSAGEFALHGVGIGLVHPVMALDYLARGLTIKPLELDIGFASLLVFRPGTPLSEYARALLKAMRIELERDLKRIRTALNT